MPEEGNVKKVFKNIPEGRRSAEKSRKRWLKMIRRKWELEAGKKITSERDDWKLILKEAKVLHGPQSQWIEKETENTFLILPFGLFSAQGLLLHSLFCSTFHGLKPQAFIYNEGGYIP